MIRRRYTAVRAPFGVLYLTAEQDQIVRIDTKKPTIADGLQSAGNPTLTDAAARLKTYFRGEDPAPSIVCLECFSPFQKQLYDAVRAIPYGETRSVEQLAEILGRTDSIRAITLLCRSNPLWIVVPTHRVTYDTVASNRLLSPEEALRRMEARNRSKALDKGRKRGYTF